MALTPEDVANVVFDTTRLRMGYDVAQVDEFLEKVADEIAQQILNNFKVNSVKVTLHKPQAPLDMEFKDVSVSVERRK